MYRPRLYRDLVKSSDLKVFQVTVKETDLLISATELLSDLAYSAVEKYRQQLEQYIELNPSFFTSFQPFPSCDEIPPIVRDMVQAAQLANVGPMASIAGAIAEYVGKELLQYSEEVIVENGGDVYLKLCKKRHIDVYTGDSALMNHLVFEIEPEKTPLGICTSSGKLSHSFSFGNADAVTIFSHSATIADAVATAIGNMVQTPDDVSNAIEAVRKIPGIRGAVIVIDGKLGIFGDMKLIDAVRI